MPTLLHYLSDWADENPNSTAQSYQERGSWKKISAQEYRDRVYWLALFLESKGITNQDVVTILSLNCPAWVHLALAAHLIGAKSAGIYPNSVGKDIQYVLNHTESRVFAVQDKEYFENASKDSGIPERIKIIIAFNEDASFSPLAITYSAALAEGKKLAQKKSAQIFRNYLDKMDPHEGAFLIYTSGTTGTPKGALLSHDNFASTMRLGAENWNIKPGEGHRFFSFLPLCHVTETLQNFAGGIYLRGHVIFASKIENLSKELPSAQPTVLVCVPRLWEKMREGVLQKVENSSGFKKKLAKWALQAGEKYHNALITKEPVKLIDFIQFHLADRLVLSKIRSALGVADLKVPISGAATLSPAVCKWFRCLGIDIKEIYGQSESSSVNTMTLKGVDCVGTVGKAIPGLSEIKIAKDGEILARGSHIFLGYFKDEAATRQALDGGWLHTGDLGQFDDRGLLKIVGRKKEVLKTSGGKMVAPVPIEDALKTLPIISQVCMVGDGRKFLSALVTLTEAKLSQLSQVNGALRNGIITDSSVMGEIKKHLDNVNSTLSNYAQIKKFAVLSTEFSVANGEMTPTLKMKRNVIESHYKDVIEQFYASD